MNQVQIELHEKCELNTNFDKMKKLYYEVLT